MELVNSILLLLCVVSLVEPYSNQNVVRPDHGFQPIYNQNTRPTHPHTPINNYPQHNHNQKPILNQNTPQYSHQDLPKPIHNNGYEPLPSPTNPPYSNHELSVHNNGYKPLVTPSQDYDYALPLHKVTSCPSFASFKFSCQVNHLLSIESVVFSQVFVDERGECVADWKAECRDDSDALDFTVKQCSGQESCNIYSYNLRSRTKCNYHQVISVFYRCVPTFEVVNVPIKCDICKNVTVNSHNDNYGFIHSAWYPKLYPRETCHSLIQNKPDHFIIIYSVSGFIGLDRIEIESVNQYGALVIKETLTGNLTTQLVLTSAFNVNITVITSDTYYQSQRKFLLYFFIVPKCTVVLCSNVTGHPGSTFSHTTLPTIVFTNVTNQSIFAPPLVAGSTHKKLSDAWLAAILALAYALLMVFAVLLALYCRRRRQRYLNNSVMFSPSSISQSQMMNPLSRAPSQISLKNEINLPISSVGYLANHLDQSGFYSHSKENYNLGYEESTSKIQHYDEDYSQVVTEEDNLSVHASTFMNYGDVDVQDRRQSSDLSYHGSALPNIDLNSLSYPYSMKTNTQHGSILASGLNDKSLYRAVEFTNGPSVERVCVRNMNDSLFDTSHAEDNCFYESKKQFVQENSTSYQKDFHSSNEQRNSEKTYVVKLFPIDDKEVQEMSMFVDNRH
ncbi:hypothetical protein BpHYR1_036982 [Brachionus plicatilis]|uniref:SUEL-type lectin domain-containing protein n=1 Tax=Brachionus plicatilis TaxID=10195 RepID=A0A3M7SY16_BRAPC|nr:hypothetical protein BpHYR1_036982 [Brachionus plicatilis]